MSNANMNIAKAMPQGRETCLCLGARRAARALSRRFDAVFHPLGITNGQFSLLAVLGSKSRPAMGEVVRALEMDQTTLTAALKPLVRRGLVIVAIDAEDRRARRLALTAKGRRLLDRAVPLWKEEHAAIEARLGKAGAQDLRQALALLSAQE